MADTLRLSGISRPERYELRLDVYLESFRYDGQVRISIKQAEPSKTVRLHAVGLEIGEGSASWGDVTQEMKSCKVLEKSQMVELQFEDEIPSGMFDLDISFKGHLREKMEGFYRSSYKNGGYMATTHFEPTDARRAFPCFDEPSFRAKFSITMGIELNRQCVSNMPVEVEQASDDRRLTKFQETPSMPTYLVAFVVGDLERSVTTSKRGVTVEVITKPGEQELGRFALETGTNCLDFFEEFFRVEYPLPKMSMVAIPDFPIGAMENWGCILFRETAILSDDKLSSIIVRQRAGETICHEIAHMWFGNLVTVSWWEHLWLKEGFATWASMVAIHDIYKEWKEPLKFTCSSYLSALRLDSLLSTHSIEVPVEDPGQINEAFDAISYLKAASLIRMLADFVTVDEFRAALKTYLERHQYGAATTVDLWNAVAEQTNLPMESMMSSWTKLEGYPLIEVTESSSGHPSVVQSRFTVAATTETTRAESSKLWMVPLTYSTASEPDTAHRFILKEASTRLPFDVSKEQWFLLNSTRAGFYRVNYPPRVWNAIILKLGSMDYDSSEAIPASARAGLLSDAFALARKGALSTTVALDLLLSLRGENEFAVWEGVVSVLYDVKRVFCDSYPEGLEHWRSLAKKVVSMLSDLVSGDQGSELELELPPLRRIVMSLLLAADDDSTKVQASELYEQFVKDPESVSPELVAPTFAHHVSDLGEQGYEDILKLYNDAVLNELRVTCLSVLGMASGTEKLRMRTLDFALREVRAQDAFHAIGSVPSADEQAKDLVWSWLQNRWEEIKARFCGGSHVLPRIVNAATKFSEDGKAAEVQAFFQGKDQSGFATSIANSVEGITADAAWRTNSTMDVRNWLTRQFS
ncbi:hypothetical protein NDN08_002307 [Rhodosorus marinus]|uniref:Aminopeptidase n=1 Tax=Rhodosorus marinus TaxID=101924 RepID=A0AAV8UXR8_9RHOD|nr:hypothetical protein NDN08_002307 [Rhodosorus marinus]